VLAHHRAHAPLWWVCARILAAADAAGAAHDAVRLLESDRTGDRLGATLPLLDENEVVAVVGWPPAVDEAMTERLDLDVVALRVAGVDPTRALRRRRTEHAVRVRDPYDPTLSQVARLLVPAIAIGPDEAVVPFGTADAIATLRDVTAETWLVGGVGRVLPPRLYAMLAAGLTEDDDVETITLERFDRLAGPRGVERPADAAARVDCPTVPELLRPLAE
jgi:hypothetical protein